MGRAKSATAIVLDPRTGDVLAMADAPGFDANPFGSTPPAVTRNRAVTDVYEPGSTFKLVTVAGVLSDRLVTPQTRFTLPYSIQVADRVIHDAEQRGTETLSVARILAQSSNVGAITLAEKLGPERLYRWMRRFGFGATTGVGFPGESAGFVLKPDQWSGSTIGNVPIGQGVAVTPVQMAAAYATIANRGVWVQPHLLARPGSQAAHPKNRAASCGRAIAAELNAMLQNVVLEGTGTLAAVPGYKVAGKTGTAQKPDSHGGYASGRYVASFVGMVPRRSRGSSCSSRSTSRAARSGAASSPRPPSRRSPASTCSTSKFRRTPADSAVGGGHLWAARTALCRTPRATCTVTSSPLASGASNARKPSHAPAVSRDAASL